MVISKATTLDNMRISPIYKVIILAVTTQDVRELTHTSKSGAMKFMMCNIYEIHNFYCTAVVDESEE